MPYLYAGHLPHARSESDVVFIGRAGSAVHQTPGVLRCMLLYEFDFVAETERLVDLIQGVPGCSRGEIVQEMKAQNLFWTKQDWATPRPSTVRKSCKIICLQHRIIRCMSLDVCECDCGLEG